MPLIPSPSRRYLVTAADGGSWAKVAAACGVTKEVLWQWNTPDGKYRALVIGEKLDVPFGSP